MQLFYPLSILFPRKKMSVTFLLFNIAANMAGYMLSVAFIFTGTPLKTFHMLKLTFIVDLKA